ncbi:MAG: hypothetical protein ACFFD4_01245 [Candidatus Odinarchaeota archaeon]
MLTPKQASVVRKYYKRLDNAELSIIDWKFRHIKFKKINGRFMRINDSINSSEQLLRHLKKHSPGDAFFTPVTWLDPVMVKRTPGSLDVMLSAPLYIDIDQKDQKPPIWGKTKEEASRLIDFIETTYGLKADLVIFSGREGFHIYYWKWVDSNIVRAAAQRRLFRFIKSRTLLFNKLRGKGFLLDRAVMVDPYRALRIPGSLSSKTLLKATLVPKGDVRYFSPETAAVMPPDFYTEEKLVDWQNYD